MLFPRKCKKQLLYTGLDAVKTTSKKVVHKACKFLEIKSNDDKTVKQEPLEEIIIPLEKWNKILDKLRNNVL